MACIHTNDDRTITVLNDDNEPVGTFAADAEAQAVALWESFFTAADLDDMRAEVESFNYAQAEERANRLLSYTP